MSLHVAEALERLATDRFECMITDLRLTDGSGHELLERMRARLRQDGARVRSYRITPLEAGAYTSSVYSGRTASVLTWETPVVTASAASVEIELEYLLPGASWTPTYDMQVVDEENVALAFFAEICNSALSLDDTQVVLVAGRVDLSQQLDQVPMVTANQYAVGYEPVDVPGLGAGALDLQHIYAAGGSRDPEELYTLFRGRMPTPEAMMEKRGLL